MAINLIIYLLKKYSDGYRACFDIQDKVYIGYVIVLFVFLVVALLDSFKPRKTRYENLFSERKYDLERLINYIQQFNTIGINAYWGDGKSFLFKLLQEECSNKYCYINIGVLSVTVDTIEKFVVDEINHILEENGIFSSASTKINEFVKQPILHNLGNLFINSNSYTELFGTLSEDVQRLKKTIILTFEDIDRIKSTETIYKIFALSDKLACENIKILYQYDENELLKILQVKKLYLEKYIPYAIDLTQIKFQRIISVFLENNKYKNIDYKDFEFITLRTIFIPWQIKRKLNINFNIEFDIYGFSIRKIKIFLEEIDNALKNEVFTNYKRQVITFFFIKHFRYHIFEKLSIDDSFLDLCKFVYKKKEYTIYELCGALENGHIKDSDIFDVFKTQYNREILALICFFDFKFTWSPQADNIQSSDKVYSIQTEEVSIIQDKQTNEKIDRLIWNLICNGKSEYTDFENAVKEMNRLVLNQPTKELQEEGYEKLSKIMYYENFEKAGNNTIFRFGISNQFSLFLAYLIYESSVEQWIKLIDFFIKENDEITSHLIQTLNYCKLDDRDVLLHIFKRFSTLSVVGNLNKSISYKKFLHNYFSAIMNNGYIRTDKLRWLKNDDFTGFEEEKDMYIGHIIPECLEAIEKVPSYTNNVEILNQFAIIRQFIEKNKEIINASKDLNEFIPEVKFSSSMTDLMVEKAKQYSKMDLSKAALRELLEKQYLAQEINFYQYKFYMENVSVKE